VDSFNDLKVPTIYKKISQEQSNTKHDSQTVRPNLNYATVSQRYDKLTRCSYQSDPSSLPPSAQRPLEHKTRVKLTKRVKFSTHLRFGRTQRSDVMIRIFSGRKALGQRQIFQPP